jgi:hypothetical protein
MPLPRRVHGPLAAPNLRKQHDVHRASIDCVSAGDHYD